MAKFGSSLAVGEQSSCSGIHPGCSVCLSVRVCAHVFVSGLFSCEGPDYRVQPPPLKIRVDGIVKGPVCLVSADSPDFQRPQRTLGGCAGVTRCRV